MAVDEPFEKVLSSDQLQEGRAYVIVASHGGNWEPGDIVDKINGNIIPRTPRGGCLGLNPHIYDYRPLKYQKQKQGEPMNEQIIKLYPDNTANAVLVNKHFKSAFDSNPLLGIALAEKVEEVLAAAKAKEEEKN